MRTNGSILRTVPGQYESAVLELDEPHQGELMVRLSSSGLCHSDDHAATGDYPVFLPMCGGHEGAGVIEKVGPNTLGFEVGDHVVMSFLPACGKCLWCAQGKQELCDFGQYTLAGSRPTDPPTYRMSVDGQECAQYAGLSTFSELTTVSVDSVVKVPKEVPLRALALLGCGVSTGWGTAVNAANIRPGDTVIVMGMGGIGTSAVQGAAHRGASHLIVVDPSAYKRDAAKQFGATESFATIEEATERAQGYTNGQGADSTIVTVGRLQPIDLTNAVDSIRKGGTVALTAMGSFEPQDVVLNLGELAVYEKTIKGVIFGNWSPRVSIPTLLSMYRLGQLKLDEMITHTYNIDQVAQSYLDLWEGGTIRGIVEF